jgi:multiple sugar transport system substrate-binding protein
MLISRRGLFALSLATGAMLSSTAVVAAPTVLKFWTFLATQGSDPRSAALLGIIDGFNKSQSQYEVRIESINFARIDSVVIQSTAAGQGPDILNVYTDQLPMHVAAKTIQPIDKYVAAMTDAERKDFAINLDFVKFDGHTMALPWEMRVWLWWYRKDLLEKTGQKLPKTLDELAATGTALSSDQVMGFGFGASTAALGSGAIETFIPLFWGAGGTLFNARGEATVNSEAGVKTLNFVKELIAKKAMRSTIASMSVEDALTAVKAGTIASTIMGSFRVGAARNAPATGANLQTTPIPGWTADKPSPARLAGQTLTIGANSRNQDGAFEFIKYYTSPASQLAFAKAGVMPSKLSTYNEPFFTQDDTAKDMRVWSEYARAYGKMEPTPADFSKLSEEVAKAIQRVIINGDDPKKALDDAAAAYNAQRS